MSDRKLSAALRSAMERREQISETLIAEAAALEAEVQRLRGEIIKALALGRKAQAALESDNERQRDLVAALEAEVARLCNFVAAEHQAYLRAEERAAEAEANAARYEALREAIEGARGYHGKPEDIDLRWRPGWGAALYEHHFSREDVTLATGDSLDALADSLIAEQAGERVTP